MSAKTTKELREAFVKTASRISKKCKNGSKASQEYGGRQPCMRAEWRKEKS